MKSKITVFWFRRDLRWEDNVGLYEALNSDFPVLPIFIFDQEILSRLENKSDRRVDYIHQSLQKIHEKFKSLGSGLLSFYGDPLNSFEQLTNQWDVQCVYCNRDYEPDAIRRDNSVKHFLATKGISFHDYKDQAIFDTDQILKKDGSPYTVFTPYSKQWKARVQQEIKATYPADISRLLKWNAPQIHSLHDLGFEATDIDFLAYKMDISIISNYDKFRDFPGANATTNLGLPLRFGTISIRQCVVVALKNNETWLNQLIWRDFFMQILYHFPQVVQQSFKPKYDRILWRNDESEFKKWCDGQTGYPMVDAGMRQLNQTGEMHNRVRMIVASFLCKHLLIDWRWGEAYFAQKLNDFDLSANNGNWQWAAGCGCDAVPYFRVFNPQSQLEKFDKDVSYILKWVPEYGTSKYVAPMVDHKMARERALQVYASSLNSI